MLSDYARRNCCGSLSRCLQFQFRSTYIDDSSRTLQISADGTLGPADVDRGSRTAPSESSQHASILLELF